MLRLKRMAVLCVVLVFVITGFLFWALRAGGQQAGMTLPAPPQSAARLGVLSTNSTHALNVTKGIVDGQWLAATAAETGIPARALQAYATGAAAANHKDPACGIGWNTVAAIGFVESAHGTYGGGSLPPAGQAAGPIVGPRLDGGGFAAIADTDAGALDGDPHWDRAVGPMQFIPSTWQFAGRDGDGDGNADPFNIDDAAVSAAVYLCGGGRDLVTDRGWADAVHAYNQSDAYVAQVRETATAYAASAQAVS
ncbi:MAG TPA: lytic transglycosylase domain-containing protein [Arthrobacter sp.]|nr:lytic transglycosylase domain-containing protein [Arthrobacter sp.]